MIFFPSQWRVVSAVYLMVICNLCKNMTVKEMVVWPTFFQLWSRIWMMMMEDHPYRSPRCSPTLDCSGVKRFASVAASAQCSELAWDIPPGSHPCRMRDQWTFFPVTYLLSVSKKIYCCYYACSFSRFWIPREIQGKYSALSRETRQIWGISKLPIFAKF